MLRDEVGNRFCVGCKVVITYDEGRKQQIREVKLSGGFLSFDDGVVYFGLGGYEVVEKIEVIWHPCPYFYRYFCTHRAKMAERNNRSSLSPTPLRYRQKTNSPLW